MSYSKNTELPDRLDPHSHINQISNSLNIDDDTIDTAHTIVENAPTETTTGKKPAGVAAGAVYLASLQHIDGYSQQKIAKAAGVSENTVRLRYQALNDEQDTN